MLLTHTIDDAVLPNVTAEREAYNAALPADPNAAPGASNPQAFATNEAFLKFQVDELVRGYMARHKRLPAPPPAPDPNAVPDVVTKKQGLKALARADLPEIGLPAPIYEADIVARIEAMPETTAEERLAKNDMRIEYGDAQTWRRGNPFFETMVTAMGISAETRDKLLKLAATFVE